MKRIGIIVLFTFLILPQATFSLAAAMTKPAPDFSLEDINGKLISLKDYQGKIVFLDFWASWCSPCRKEFPELVSMLERETKDEVVVIAVNEDRYRRHAEKFLKNLSGTPESLIVLFDKKSKVIESYGVKAMPTSYIIDKAGMIRHIHFGYSKKEPAKWVEEINEIKRGG